MLLIIRAWTQVYNTMTVLIVQRHIHPVLRPAAGKEVLRLGGSGKEVLRPAAAEKNKKTGLTVVVVCFGSS